MGETDRADYLARELRPSFDENRRNTTDINKTLSPISDNRAEERKNRLSINSEHEEFLHPNMRSSTKEVRQEDKNTASYLDRKRKKFNSCKSCFRRFDELILKPIMIHNYDKVLQNKKAEFMELFMGEVEDLEDEYVKVNKFEDPQEQRKHNASTIFKRITQHSRRNSLTGENQSLNKLKTFNLKSPQQHRTIS